MLQAQNELLIGPVHGLELLRHPGQGLLDAVVLLDLAEASDLGADVRLMTPAAGLPDLVFTANGIRIVDKNGTSLALESGGFALTDSHGNVISTGAGGITITPAAGGTVTIHGKVFETHAHTGVTTGGGISGPPA